METSFETAASKVQAQLQYWESNDQQIQGLIHTLEQMLSEYASAIKSAAAANPEVQAALKNPEVQATIEKIERYLHEAGEDAPPSLTPEQAGELHAGLETAKRIFAAASRRQ